MRPDLIGWNWVLKRFETFFLCVLHSSHISIFYTQIMFAILWIVCTLVILSLYHASQQLQSWPWPERAAQLKSRFVSLVSHLTVNRRDEKRMKQSSSEDNFIESFIIPARASVGCVLNEKTLWKTVKVANILSTSQSYILFVFSVYEYIRCCHKGSTNFSFSFDCMPLSTMFAFFFSFFKTHFANKNVRT